ncbi:oligosaccharide flippase family protein [Enterococcus raffinosus]|uniref:lipopolysaccharide biosynthesis protein n=1 Tax=Enterococcus raffinosus TaxID=71452 RepID=UPI00288DC872|nr:oligosaccharide flippase family protein [Enterococcus raffinosus]MDT2573626.1 oligosaccharide flippase family protein [Enterococcus raffinosus]
MSILINLKKSKLVKSSFWYTIGNFFIKGISFITIPIFVNITTQAEYGLINNFTSFVTIFSLFIGLSLNSSVNNASFDFKDRMKPYLSSILFLSTLSFLGMLVIGNSIFLFKQEIFDMNQLLFNLMLIQSYSTFLISYIQAYFTIHFQHFRYLALSLISTLLNIGLSVLLMLTFFTDDRYVGRAFAGAVALGVVGLAIYIMIMTKGKKLIDFSFWNYALRISVPLIPHALANVMLSQFDRIMINSTLGASEAGIYSYISNIGIILSVIWSSTNNAWVPWFYNEMERKNEKKIFRVSQYYMYAFTTIALAMMVISIDLAKFMAPSNYYSGLSLVIPISLGYFFQFLYSFPVNTEFYKKKTNYIAFGTVASAAINIILNLIFIPRYGVIAAGYTTTVTYFLLFLFHYPMAKKFVGKQLFPTKSIISTTIIMVVFSMFLHAFLDNIFIRYIGLLFISVGALLYFRKNKDKFKADSNLK